MIKITMEIKESAKELLSDEKVKMKLLKALR